MTRCASPLPVRTRTGDPLRLALALWLAVGLAVGVRTLIRPDSHTVFPIFASAVGHYWSDQPLYDRDAVLDDFRYPPTFAVAVTPLGLLGLRAGGILWSWLGLAVYGAGLWRFGRDVLPEAEGKWSRSRTAALLVLGLLGALRGLWNAQSNALVMGLVLLAAAALVRRRWWSAALLLGGAVWIKLTPLALALLFVALWPRRLALRLGVVLIVLALPPFVTRPPGLVLSHYADWAGHLAQSGPERWPGFRDAWTVWAAARHMASGQPGPLPLKAPLDSPVYRVIQLLSAAAVLAWCLAQQRRGAGPARLVNGTLALGCAWLMLFGPAVEHATYVFLAPALAWALLQRHAWPRGRVLITASGVLVLLLGWGSLTRPLAERLPLVYAILPLGTALFVGWLIGYERTRDATAVVMPLAAERTEPATLAA